MCCQAILADLKSHHSISVKWPRYWAYQPIPNPDGDPDQSQIDLDLSWTNLLSQCNHACKQNRQTNK